jgi:hypothetical protein
MTFPPRAQPRLACVRGVASAGSSPTTRAQSQAEVHRRAPAITTPNASRGRVCPSHAPLWARKRERAVSGPVRANTPRSGDVGCGLLTGRAGRLSGQTWPPRRRARSIEGAAATLQATAHGGAGVARTPANEATAPSARPWEGLRGSIGLGADLRHLGGGWFYQSVSVS